MKDVNETMQKLNETLRPVTQSLANFSKRIRPAIDSIEQLNKQLQPILQRQQEFLAHVQEINKQREETKQVMIESGWWFTPSMMSQPAHEIDKYIEEYRQGNNTAVFNLHKKVYETNNCNQLEVAVNHWCTNLLFTPWIQHIESALEAHKQKKYELSVPVLLLVSEGIATQFCKSYQIQFDNNPGSQKKIYEALKKTYEDDTNILSTYLDVLWKALQETIYQKTHLIGPELEQDILNRHAVMHGLKNGYGTLRSSLQTFMLLDVLSELK